MLFATLLAALILPGQNSPNMLVPIWSNQIYMKPDVHDSNPVPTLAGRLYLLGDNDQLIAARGTVIVDLYDVTNRQKPNQLERWQIDPDFLKKLAKIDGFGLGSILILPWQTYRPDIKKVEMRTQLLRENLPPLNVRAPAFDLLQPANPEALPAGVQQASFITTAPAKGAPAQPETRLIQVSPALKHDQLRRTEGQDRAVVLIHGLKPHFFSSSKVNKAEMHAWQLPDSAMVKGLAGEGDIFAFAYGQTTAADDVADQPDLSSAVRSLRGLGYRQIVLVGHSAGGLIVRQFVEDHPDSGVTKVIQIDAPNGGSFWASVLPVSSNQREFVGSLSKTERSWLNQLRADKRIPAGVEMVCIVGTGGIGGDGLVATASQWPLDLREQGIPAYHVATTHREMTYCNRGVALVVRLVHEPQPRWDAKEIATFCHKLGIANEAKAK